MTRDLGTSLTAAQARSIALSDARVNVWTGSISSGKTVGSLLRWLMYVADAPYGGELVMIGRTRESIGRNVFGPYADPSLFGPMIKHVSYTPGAPTGKILGRTVHVLGASDARAEMVLRGLTCAGAYVDEATLISEAFWTQLLGRLRVPGAKIFATTNPDGPAHWFKRAVVDRVAELGYRHFHFLLADNPFLDPVYVGQITREYVGLWHRRFILGEWVQAEGAVYDMWDQGLHLVNYADLPTMKRILALGVDVGTTNPTRGILLGLGVDGLLYAADEWSPPKMTDAHFSVSLQAWTAARVGPEWVFVDPSAASFKLQLFEDGVRNVADADNDVLDGIRTVSSLLATRQLRVSSSCVQLLNEFPGYSWDDKATQKGEDRPIKAADHSLDALRYAVASTRFTWAREIRAPLSILDKSA